MSAKRSKKQPRAAVSLSPEKRPAAVVRAVDSTSHLRLSWRFGGADPGGPWSLSNCDAGTLQQIISKMASFETMLVKDIRVGDMLKSYAVDQIPNPVAVRRLTELDLDDRTELHRLRWSGAARLYGWLDDAAVFDVLWWDPKHEVWPSTLRNT